MFPVAQNREKGVRVKICGITNWADAKLAIDAGVDALGFNFYPPSPRYVTPAVARRIVCRLPRGTTAVGIFVDESPADVGALARAVGLDWVQLHGAERPPTVQELAGSYLVIKAFQVRDSFHLARLRSYRRAAAFLLDGFRPRLYGGTGQPFDWRVAERAKRYGRIIVAGGLAPENVARAIREVQPFAIDVCSGVEAEPGKKDAARLRELMEQVEAARSGFWTPVVPTSWGPKPERELR